MLKTLNLTFFRRHESLHVDFVTGLNVIRGPNEAGKSTLLEGVLYALGGAKTLRDTLAETVTWGHKERELKVQLVLTSGGHDHVFKRGKSGAECHYVDGDGVQQVITGQDEVTAKATDLLGCDLKMAANLMLSSQAGLRGALEEGPTAVSNMMAKLGDVDIIDRIVATATANLATGADAPLKAKLEDTKQALSALLEMPPVDNSAEIRGELTRVANAIQVLRVQIDGELGEAFQAADNALGRAEAARQAYMHNADGLAKAESTVASLQAQHAAALARADQRPTDAAIADAEAAVAREKDHAALVALHRRVTALPYPEAYWDEPVETLHAAIDAAEAVVTRCATVAAEHQQKIAAQRVEVSTGETTVKNILAGKITNGKCPTCGSTKNSDEHVAAHNAEVDEKANFARQAVAAAQARLVELEAGLVPLRYKVVEAQAEVAELRKLVKDSKPFDDLAAAVEASPYVKVDRSIYPPKTTWIAEVPAAVAGNVAAGTLAGLQAQVRAALQAEGEAKTLEASLKVAVQTRDDWVIALTQTPDVDPAPFVAARAAAWEAYSTANSKLLDLGAQRDMLNQQLVTIEASRTAYVQRVAGLQARITEIEGELKTLAFNNAFVAKLKAMKPKVTDRLWNTVLAAASNAFSAMRGETSIITRNGGNFLVNDKSAGSLSGSTLDVMALAIRWALTRTFLPHVPFISLDEPAHGCDADRTSNLLGFLSSCGFKQVILASHDEMSEAVADQVIALGA